jgi:branched-chain amino acid transport system ATP-binding protein
MVQPREGSIRFVGKEIARHSPMDVLRRGIGYVPQARCNFPAMSVEENLEMGAYLRRDARVRGDIEALLARFPMLATKRRDLAGTLSGGQQQILEMAIALLLHPRVLMVDEPSLGLAPAQALSVSHRGFVLELGRNRFQGTGRELLDNPDVRQHYLGG